MCTMPATSGGTLYILYSIAGKLLNIFVNHFGGHISMDPFGHLSMESLIGVPLWNRYRTLGGDPNTIIHPYFDFVNKKIKNVLTESLSMCIIYIISSYQRVTHNKY